MGAIIGQPVDRIDGPLKVSGRATYAAEYWDVGQPLYGFIVGATIGKGRITAIDTTRAEQAPGVRMVMTHGNAPGQGKADPSVSAYSRAFPALAGPDIHHFGEPVAFVVATTFEQARAAANLVAVSYARESGRFDFSARLNEAFAPETVNAGLPTDSAVGDFDGAFSSAEVTVDQTYTTPFEFSQPMEPHACLAVPSGDDLILYASCQIVAEARTAVASTLEIDKDRVHIVSAFVGGGFGSKLGIHSETILAAMAARELKTPVKVVMCSPPDRWCGNVCAGTRCVSGDQSPRAGQAGSGVGAGMSCHNRIYQGVVEERRAAAAVARLVEAASGGEPLAGVIAGCAALAAEGVAATVFADDPAVPLA